MRASANPQGNARTAAPGSSKPPASLPVPVQGATEVEPLTVEVPEPPEHLGPEAVELWHEVWTDGGAAYRPTDRHVIERYCSLQERRQRFLRILDDEGFTTVGSQGQVVAHPAARLLLDIEGKLGPLEDRLGLNPESRIRLGLGAQELTRNALDAFLNEDDVEEVE